MTSLLSRYNRHAGNTAKLSQASNTSQAVKWGACVTLFFPKDAETKLLPVSEVQCTGIEIFVAVLKWQYTT